VLQADSGEQHSRQNLYTTHTKLITKQSLIHSANKTQLNNVTSSPYYSHYNVVIYMAPISWTYIWCGQ